MTYIFIDNVEEEKYSNFVLNHKYSHFLKSYEWGEVSKTRNLTPYYIGLSDGKNLVATALLLKKKLPFGYSYFYIPRGYTIDYENYDILYEFTKRIKDFTKKHKSIFFKIDPDIYLHHIDDEANVIQDGLNNYTLVNNLKKIGFKRRKLTKFFETMQPRYTFRIDLKDDLENIRNRYSKTVFRFLKQANKYNVEVKIGTKENVNDFIELMKQTEKRQNFHSHDFEFYNVFYDIFKKNDYIDLLYASVDVNYIISVINEELKQIENSKKNNEEHKKKLIEMKNHFIKLNNNKKQIVSAYFNVNYGNKSWYLYGANNMEYKSTYANYKLFDFQIENAFNKNKDIFDEFGTVGDIHAKKSGVGLHEFKKKFGGEYTEFIGEFDYVTNKFMYFIYTKIVPKCRKLMKKIKRNS